MTAGAAIASSRRGRLLASGIGLSALFLLALTVWLSVLNGGPEGGVGETFALAFAFYAYMAVGLLMLARLPRNPLGWVLTAVGVLTSLGILSAEYARYGLSTLEQPPPGAVFAAWVTQWWWFPNLGLVVVFVPLLFPTGAPPSPRWRWLAWLSGTSLLLIAVAAALAPDLAADSYRVPNPVGVQIVGDVEEGGIGSVLFVLMLACVVLSFSSLVVRFRRSRGVERQQLKWFVWAVVLTIAVPTLQDVGPTQDLIASNVVFAFVVLLQPAALGLAVTRYRLYEVDRLISRSLSYALLTALLLAVYLSAVTVLTAVTTAVTPAAGESPLAVAAATLLAAAAFGPARRRIQSVVDRRFNRSRYDAARMVEAYRGRLRDELDLPSITAGLQGTVHSAVQPSRTLIWLRGADA